MDSFLNRKPNFKKATTVFISVLTVTAMLLAGCTKESEPKTVETIVNSNDDIASTIKGAADDSGVKVDIQGNTITYSYDISSVDGITEEMIGDEDFVKSLETSLGAQKSSLANVCTSIKEKKKIEGVVVKVIYSYGDKEIVSTTVTSADAVSDEAANEEAKDSE